MHPATRNNCISQHHEQITRTLNEKLASLRGVTVTHPFGHFEEGRVGGVFKLHNGRVNPSFECANFSGTSKDWSFSAHDKSLKQLERETNLDLLHCFFNHAVYKGKVKTRTLFTIAHIKYFQPSILNLLVSTEAVFKKCALVSINLEDRNSRVYNFATGKLNIKKIDDIITATLNGARQNPPGSEMDQFVVMTQMGIIQRRLQATEGSEIEEGVSLQLSQKNLESKSRHFPTVHFSAQPKRTNTHA